MDEFFDTQPEKIEVRYIQRFLNGLFLNKSHLYLLDSSFILRVVEYIKQTFSKNKIYNFEISTENDTNAAYYLYEIFSCLVLNKNIKKTIKIDSFFSKDELQFIDQFI